MNILNKTLIAASIAFASMLSHAEETVVKDINVQNIENRTTQLFGDIGIARVSPIRDVAEKAYPESSKSNSPMLELYEVKMSNGARVYTDAEANFWILSRQGLDFVAADNKNQIININGIADREDTLKAMSQLGKTIDFKSDNEKAAVTVFFDVNCGYCNKLFNERQEYLDLGISLKFAAAPIFSGSEQTMSKIWCAPDYAEKLIKYEEYTVKRRTEKNLQEPDLGASNAECLEVVQNQSDVAKAIGLKGTPLIVLENGDKIAGYTAASELAEIVKKQ